METSLTLLVAGIAMVMDLRWMRVENGWILCSLVSGLLFQLCSNGIAGLFHFLAGVTFPAVILGGLFVFRMLGAGDIKLFCALGGFMGVKTVGKCMIASFFLGGGISFLILIFYGDFHQRIRYFVNYFQELFRTGKIRPYYKAEMALENFHFTVPVFMSVLLHMGGVY